MSAKIKIWSWDHENTRWLAVSEARNPDEATADVQRRDRIAREQGIPNAAHYADTAAPTRSPMALGLTLTPVVDTPPPTARPPRKLGKHSPGARDVTLQVRGHVDDADVVWFGSLCWPRDVFEAAGGVVIEPERPTP